jgi:hypothetical protein
LQSDLLVTQQREAELRKQVVEAQAVFKAVSAHPSYSYSPMLSEGCCINAISICGLAPELVEGGMPVRTHRPSIHLPAACWRSQLEKEVGLVQEQQARAAARLQAASLTEREASIQELQHAMTTLQQQQQLHAGQEKWLQHTQQSLEQVKHPVLAATIKFATHQGATAVTGAPLVCKDGQHVLSKDN